MSVGGPVDPELEAQSVRRPPLLAAVVVVGAGGALGSVARACLDSVLGRPAGSWPWSTLGVNLTGALAIGVVMVILLERLPEFQMARLFLVTGVLGGYTTFSALTVEAVDVARMDRPYLAALYIGVTVVGAAVACLTGARLTRSALGRAPRSSTLR